MADSILTRVWEIADSYYPKRDWAHGRSHIERVLRTAVEIGKREGAHLEIIELSAILHDILANEESVRTLKDSDTKLKRRKKQGIF
ncbi:HD domain-containing protein [Candidatus Bathyarchaeota archaeon]|nr:MAG: HD domain-containing protein [Candidatus Bathyarchaeota archaeon]